MKNSQHTARGITSWSNYKYMVLAAFVLLLTLIITTAYTLPGITREDPVRTEIEESEASPSPDIEENKTAGAENEPELNNLDELTAFFDGIMNSQLDSYNVPGAVLSLVKDGEIVLARGYGYADREKRIPVTADKTLFRPGSVSKLFTWTAVMQLVEEGRLELDRDINRYLEDFKVPDTYDEPITLYNLMSHTPGFEDRGLGIWVESPEKLVPLKEYLIEDMPERVYPPGGISAYSNYGSTLAGYIVSAVSGMPFEDYIRERIFAPLEMNNSTFEQPLPERLAGDMARGYNYLNGLYRPGDFELLLPVPAGALSSTAVDMAKFMLAHLEPGRYDGENGSGRILKESTTREMHTTHFSHTPEVSGWAHGFMEMERNNKRIIFHGGDTFLFHTALYLIPGENLGLYVSYNSMGGSAARENLLEAFLDRYFPAAEPEEISPPADFKERAGMYTGSYYLSRSSHTTLEKFLSLFQTVRIGVNGEGYLQFKFAETSEWVEVEPLVFRNRESREKLVFEKSVDGGIKYAYLGNNPIMAAVKSPWYREPFFNFLILGLAVFFFSAAVIGGLIRLWLLRRGKIRPDNTPGKRWTVRLPVIIGLFNLIFVIGTFIALNVIQAAPYGIPPGFQLLLGLAVFTSLLTVLLLVLVVRAWARGYFGTWRRLYYTAFTAAAFFFVWFLYFWNLLGFKY